MNSSFVSFFLFFFVTISYFAFPSIGKLPITLNELNDPDIMKSYEKNNWNRLLLYFMMVLVSQFIFNSIHLSNKCTGDIGENIGYALSVTLGPWTLIFAILIIVLNTYPDLKNAFSDVFGYIVISSKANDIFSKMLVGDETVQNKINNTEDVSQDNKQMLSQTSDAIVKMLGNKSVIINQMHASNFLDIWNVLKPIMKPMENETEMKEDLLNLVIAKDNTGELMWYIYTGLLVVFVISYKLTVKECSQSAASMQKNEAKYQKTISDNDSAKKRNETSSE